MSRAVSVSPNPSGAEAAAIATALAAVLDEEAAAVPTDPTPAAYRSPWRTAALREGVLRIADSGWPDRSA